jgi:hypothetical protein
MLGLNGIFDFEVLDLIDGRYFLNNLFRIGYTRINEKGTY